MYIILLKLQQGQLRFILLIIFKAIKHVTFIIKDINSKHQSLLTHLKGGHIVNNRPRAHQRRLPKFFLGASAVHTF